MASQVSENLAEFALLPDRELAVGQPLVARLVGRKFDVLLDENGYENPYDPRFGKAMVKTLSHLCTVLGASFGYVERTELSLYAIAAGGDARRLLSRIAGEAAAKLSLVTRQICTFDAHLYEFPDPTMALDYFRWRHEESYQNAVHRYCVSVLSRAGSNEAEVARMLDGLGAEDKVELLRQNALDFSTVPGWQRAGVCVRLTPAESPTESPLGRLLVDLNLPVREQFGEYVKSAIVPAQS